MVEWIPQAPRGKKNQSNAGMRTSQGKVQQRHRSPALRRGNVAAAIPYDLVLDRTTIQYRRLAEAVTMREMQLQYLPSFLPGIHFYQYLAMASDVKSRQPPLALQIPDTLVVQETGEPIWMYTDTDGYVRKRSDIVFKEFEEAITPPDDEHLPHDDVSPVIIKKTAQIDILPCTKQLSSHGNNIYLLNEKEFKNVMKEPTKSRSLYVVQRFLPSSGPKASVVRVIYRKGTPMYAWRIANKVTKDSKHELIPSNKLCTTIGKDNSCTFIKLIGRSCHEVVTQNTALLHYLQHSIRRSFDFMITDFIKDEHGTYWFLQVKSFRPRGLGPGQALGLTKLIQKSYTDYRKIVTSDSDYKDVSKMVVRKRRESDFGRGGQGLYYRTRREFPCKFCGLTFPPSELPFKMTSKMINETMWRIKYRATNEDASLNFLVSGVKSASRQYQTWNVCGVCYSIFEKEKELTTTEKQFGIAIGLSSFNNTFTSKDLVDSTPLKMEPFSSFTLCRLSVFLETLYDIPRYFYDVQQMQQKPNGHTPNHKWYLRILFLGKITVLPLDAYPICKGKAPVRLYGSPATSSSPTKIIYWLTINTLHSVDFFSPNTNLKGTVRENTGLFTLLQQASSLPIDLAWTDDPSTLHGPDYQSALASFHRRSASMNQQAQLKILCETNSQPVVIFGRGNVKLSPFKSSCVSKTDLYLPLERHAASFNLKGQVALQRIRHVPKDETFAIYELTYHKGVFVPALDYQTNDVMAEEWVASLAPAPGFKKSSLTEEETEEVKKLQSVETKRDRKEKEKKRAKLLLVLASNERTGRKDHQALFETLSLENPTFSSDKGIQNVLKQEVPETESWCISVLLHRSHQLGLTSSSWQARYTLFGVVHNLLPPASPEQEPDQGNVVYNSTQQHYIVCSVKELVDAFTTTHSTLTIQFIHSKTDADSYFCKVDLSSLGTKKSIDGTYDIVPETQCNVDTFEIADDRTPYLSASFYVSPMKMNSSYKQLHTTSSGIKVYRKQH